MSNKTAKLNNVFKVDAIMIGLTGLLYI